MNPFGIDLMIWAGIVVVSLISLLIIWKIARWKGRFDQWKREMDEWRNGVSTIDSQDHSDYPIPEPPEEHPEERPPEREKEVESVEILDDLYGKVNHQMESALLYALSGREDEALKRLEEACGVIGVRNQGDMAMIHHNLGNLLYRSERFDEAEKEYMEAIKHKPDLARAHANLGFLLRRSGRQEEAIQEFKTALNSKEQLPDGGERIMQIIET